MSPNNADLLRPSTYLRRLQQRSLFTTLNQADRGWTAYTPLIEQLSAEAAG